MKYSIVIFLFCNLLCSEVYSQSQHTRNEQWLKEKSKVQNATVLLNNQTAVIPIQNLADNKIACVVFDSKGATTFDSTLNNYSKVTLFNRTDSTTLESSMADLSYDLKFYTTLIIQLNPKQLADKNVHRFIQDNQINKQVILAVFGDVQSLTSLEAIHIPIIWTAKQSDASANYVAQVIFGGMPAVARLPKNVSAKFTKGAGYTTSITRLSYTVPEELGINVEDLQKPINEIMTEAITQRATPSAVLMIVKDGKVIMNEAFGTHTYDEGALPTKKTDIYDLASVTKVTATTPSVMRLYEQGKLKLDSLVSLYIPKTRGTNKQNTPVRQVMLHEAGFTPFIPFFNDIKPNDFRRDSSAAYPIAASEHYYFRKDYFKDVMWPKMLNSALRDTGKYVYSDLSMYFMKEIVESLANDHLENYVQKNFYKGLGMQRAGYNPLYRFPKDAIIPTEVDTLFRDTLLLGYVHDPGASMVGGISGHAGLFSSSTDLAIFYQMLLNGGTYGGIQYFKPETVALFTSKQSRTSRRGLGFDRSDLKIKYPSELASANTFGHTGYTGIRVWVDKDVKLIYILLTNRVNPVTSSKLSDLNTSSRLMDAIYKALPEKR
ncbi:Beta-N-acetylglucosaminidase [Arcticibacter svalbardensis MN12-7]|uniref:Beta-N-acetylglucosaminidase n=1 Tax=Arcticibacter svalbardensis MN12-7 TaxID=1150600 RepID=R9GMN8_9SPHI|nr:serine hydrolase [Arcticibacter svalbardensis]EOR92800.1 Beta-N-acetylglucosaminidase [Arcticibacter svalbardensis MN12-7]